MPRSRTPGFMQMLTHSHRYVVPVQMLVYDGKPRWQGDPVGV